jgi:HSP20 family molecular chaperone IbpA
MVPIRYFGNGNLMSVFDEFLNMGMDNRAPAVNIGYTDDSFVVEAKVPGYTAQDLDIKVTSDNVLEITGKNKQTQENKYEDWVHQEWTYNEFTRQIKLPSDIDGEPEAKLHNGILMLNWHRNREKQKTKRIRLQT